MADWIAQDDALRQLLASPPARIGLDTEFMRTDTFWPRLALLQAEVDGRIALVDPTTGTTVTIEGIVLFCVLAGDALMRYRVVIGRPPADPASAPTDATTGAVADAIEQEKQPALGGSNE